MSVFFGAMDRTADLVTPFPVLVWVRCSVPVVGGGDGVVPIVRSLIFFVVPRVRAACLCCLCCRCIL